MNIVYTLNKSTASDIFSHLSACDAGFIPKLSDRVDLKDFSKKIKKNAVMFEAWDSDKLVGLVSAYFNDINGKISFVNNVSVMPFYSGKGIATRLLHDVFSFAHEKAFLEIYLEVSIRNKPALQLYIKNGFTLTDTNGDYIKMGKKIDFKNE